MLLESVLLEAIPVHSGGPYDLRCCQQQRYNRHIDNRACDAFSVDGGHSYHNVHADLIAAVRATRVGGRIIADDMRSGGVPKRALDDVVATGVLTDVQCTRAKDQFVSTLHRLDVTEGFTYDFTWCTAVVAR